MRVARICVGKPKYIEFDGKHVQTSIFKSPVEGMVAVCKENIVGDQQSDLTVHGGRNKAIYAYSENYYHDWALELGVTELENSQFGENLTITEGTDREVVIGSRYRLGQIEITVTQPRIPCFKLGVRLNDETFPQRFWAAGRLGFYLRVDLEGSIERDQSMKLISEPDHGITVRGLYETVTGGSPDDATIALHTLSDLDAGWVRRLRQVSKSTTTRTQIE